MNIRRICGLFVRDCRKIVTGAYNRLFYLTHSPERILLLTGYLDQIGFKIKKRNWGDDINYHLVEYLSGKKAMCIQSILHWDRIHAPNYACIGSILDSFMNKNTVVWGSGCMTEVGFSSQHPSKILAVRGRLTRDLLTTKGMTVPEVYGDPALLLPYIYDNPQGKKYRCGLIPHYIDFDLPNVKGFKERYGNEVIVIDLKHYTEWTEVIDQIRQCDFILSSSLHGIIVSDAYHVPNMWIKLSENVIGNGFKFLDYFSSVNRNCHDPADLVGKEIMLDGFTETIRPEEYMDIDLMPLIDSCPFIREEISRELKQRYLYA